MDRLPPTTPSKRPSGPPGDADELIERFASLTVQGPNSRPQPVSASPRKTQKTPDSPARNYSFQTPTKSGFTETWAEAAAETQGVPGASPRRLTKTSKPRRKKGGYAVFFGTQPGAYKTWAEAERFVKGVPGNLHQAYISEPLAQAAFDYAHTRGWTRVCPAPGSSTRASAPETLRPVSSSPIPDLPTPVGTTEAVNPLHAGQDLDVWYIVYAGITPGVYQSSLECGLNTVGLSLATYDRCESKDLAIALYQEALDAGRVSVVYPKYYA
ncbi:hypothetical protein C8R47DRAFT_1216078 [Mycena vitilis]|nr:hypothetical protein C8R47DRAFT_1216078 [Mycena vitilis]